MKRVVALRVPRVQSSTTMEGTGTRGAGELWVCWMMKNPGSMTNR